MSHILHAHHDEGHATPITSLPALTPKFEGIPQALRDLPRWVVWQKGATKRDGSGRYEKIPINAKTGKPCNAHASANWLTFDEVCAAYETGKFDGVAIDLPNERNPILFDESGAPLYLIGGDLDCCVEVVGGKRVPNTKAKAIILRLGRPYVELSPSGTGIRFFVLHRRPLKGGNRGGKELYSGGRFLTITGRSAGGGDIREVGEELEAFAAECFGSAVLPGASASTHGASINDDLTPYGSSMPETAKNIERVKSALAALPADCGYEQWRDGCFAIHSLAWECGYELFDGWSQMAPERYDPDEAAKLWNSAKPGGGVGIGTVFHRAKAAGWSDPRTVVVPGADAAIDTPMQGASGDIANGRLLATLNLDKILFVHETGTVLAFDQARGWEVAPPGHADRAAKAAIAKLREAAAERWKQNPDDPKNKRLMAHVERSSSAPKVAAMLAMAKSEPGMTVQLHELDAHPYLLGLENGIFDLKAGTLLAPDPAILVTKRCAVAYDPTATAPVWEAFIHRVTGGNSRLAGFLQRWAGYLLTGDVGEQCFAFLYGLGRNGKTTYAETLRWLLGDYAVVLPTSTLMVSKRDPGAASPDLMLLKGARAGVTNEVGENARFDEAAVKGLSGGDAITARDPYGLFATWSPTHKLMIVGNHRPVITGGDLGIWRRVRLIPFTETIADDECDPHLPDKIRAEGSGLLNWCLDGFRAWQREGLNPPPEVRGASDEYRADMDIIGQWLDEHTDTAPGALTPTAKLYRAYQVWAKAAGWTPMTKQSFGRRLAERGITTRKGGADRTKHAVGVVLNSEGRLASVS